MFISKDDVRPDSDLNYKHIGMLWDNKKFVLYSELEDKWIFRHPLTPNYGHSGHHRTKKAACYTAYETAHNQGVKCAILGFHSAIEIDGWLMSPVVSDNTMNETKK